MYVFEAHSIGAAKDLDQAVSSHASQKHTPTSLTCSVIPCSGLKKEKHEQNKAMGPQ